MPRLKAIGLDIELTKDFAKLSGGKKVPMYAPLLKTTFEQQSGELKTSLLVTPDGWGLVPSPNGQGGTDFGSDLNLDLKNPDSYLRYVDEIVQTVEAFKSSSLSLVVHSQEGNNLICQLYLAEGSQFRHLCTRYTYNFANPWKEQDGKVVLDARCDEVHVYSPEHPAPDFKMGKLAKQHFEAIDMRTTLEEPPVVKDLAEIQPARGRLEVIRGEESPNPYDNLVQITIPLGRKEHGSEKERKLVEELEHDMRDALAEQETGEYDGNEFGNNTCNMFLYGHNSDDVFETVKPLLDKFSLKPLEIYLQYGPPDSDNLKSKRVKLS